MPIHHSFLINHSDATASWCAQWRVDSFCHAPDHTLLSSFLCLINQFVCNTPASHFLVHIALQHNPVRVYVPFPPFFCFKNPAPLLKYLACSHLQTVSSAGLLAFQIFVSLAFTNLRLAYVCFFGKLCSIKPIRFWCRVELACKQNT